MILACYLIYLCDMSHTFEFVLHFVRCNTATVSSNHIIIIIIMFHSRTINYHPEMILMHMTILCIYCRYIIYVYFAYVYIVIVYA